MEVNWKVKGCIGVVFDSDSISSALCLNYIMYLI